MTHSGPSQPLPFCDSVTDTTPRVKLETFRLYAGTSSPKTHALALLHSHILHQSSLRSPNPFIGCSVYIVTGKGLLCTLPVPNTILFLGKHIQIQLTQCDMKEPVEKL